MPLDPLARARRYRWAIFVILSLGYILVYFHRLCPAVLAVDIMQDLHASAALTGWLGAAYFYPYALMQLPAGLLADSWGARKTITCSLVVAVAGSVLLGLAPSVGWAVLGRALVGAGVAMVFVPSMKNLAEWFHAREFASLTGILMAMGGLGSLSAATPLVWLSSGVGWRNSFLVVAGATLVVAVLAALIVRNRPSDLGWPSPAAREPGAAPPPAAIGLGTAMKLVVSCPRFWALAVWFFFDCGIFFSFGGLWGGPYLRHVYHLDKDEAGRILSMLAIGMVVGSPLLSLVSDRVCRARKPVLLASSVILVLLTGVLAFHPAGLPRPGLYLLCFLLGVCSSAIVVIAFTMNKELFPVAMAGTATGLINLFPFAGGAVFQPVLGYVIEGYGKVDGAFTLAGYRAAFLLLFASALIALVASLFTRETITRT